MDIENRLITNDDLDILKKYRDEQGVVVSYVHPN